MYLLKLSDLLPVVSFHPAVECIQEGVDLKVF